LAAASISRNLSGRTFALTGSGSWSFAEIAALMASILCRPMRYSMCSPADYLKRARSEMDDPWPQAFSTLCAAIRQGRYEAVSTDFERLVGRPAEGLESFLRRAFAWKTGISREC
jgi:NAD(P)H dehydrogenase (quinone)